MLEFSGFGIFYAMSFQDFMTDGGRVFFKTFVEWVEGPGGQDDLAFIVFTNGFWSIS